MPRLCVFLELLLFSLIASACIGLLEAHVSERVYSSISASTLTFQETRVRSGRTVGYDSRAIIIDGKRRLLMSGSIHYPRSTPQMWPLLMRNAREGGLDVVQTYVFWNGHEPRRGEYDFSGRYDLVKFVRDAHKEGLLVNLRIGPYVCAEWKLGGFPTWLREMKGIEFRTHNPVFMAEMQRFMKYIIDLMTREKLWYPQGGPIIMAQVENEYGNFEVFYAGPGRRYVEWFSTLPALLGPRDIVWITCRQDDAPDTLINGCNDFYCKDFLPGSASHPMLWTENWMGWFQRWGQGYPRRPVHDIAYAVAAFIARGGSYNNYYMYHGGTNFELTAARLLVTSYGYDAPLDEFGLPREPKYSHLLALHAALHNCSDALLAVDPPAPIVPGPGVKVFVYGSLAQEGGGSLAPNDAAAASSDASESPPSPSPSSSSRLLCAAFIINSNEQMSMQVVLFGKTFNVPPWSVSILPDCVNEAFNTAQVRGSHYLPHASRGGAVWPRPRPVSHAHSGPHFTEPKPIRVQVKDPWRKGRLLLNAGKSSRQGFGRSSNTRSLLQQDHANGADGGRVDGSSGGSIYAAGGDQSGVPSDAGPFREYGVAGGDAAATGGGAGAGGSMLGTAAMMSGSAPQLQPLPLRSLYEVAAAETPQAGSADPNDHGEAVVSYLLRERAPGGGGGGDRVVGDRDGGVGDDGGGDDSWQWWAWAEPRHPSNPAVSWLLDVAPLDQTSVTLDTTDYMWYSRNFSLGPPPARPQYDNDGFGPVAPAGPTYECQLALMTVRDIVAVYLDDEYQAMCQPHTCATALRNPSRLPGRFVNHEVPLEASYKLKLTVTPGGSDGIVRLDLLSTTIGLANYGEQFEVAQGGISGPIRFSCSLLEPPGPPSLSNLASSYSDGFMWAHQVGLSGERFDLPSSITRQGPWPKCMEEWGSRDRCGWQPVTLSHLQQPLVWFTTHFDLGGLHRDEFAPGKGAWVLDLTGMGKGLAWVNGHCLGRTWPSMPAGGCTVGSFADCERSNAKYSQESCKTDCHKPSQTRYHVPRDWLKEEANVVVLFEELGGDASQVMIKFMEHEDI